MKYKTMLRNKLPNLAILLILSTLLTTCTSQTASESLPPTETPTSIPGSPKSNTLRSHGRQPGCACINAYSGYNGYGRSNKHRGTAPRRKSRRLWKKSIKWVRNADWTC